MKKFNNVIDQINEVLRQQWTLQALRRKAECTGHPAEVQQQITAARLRLICARRGYLGRTAPVQSSPAPPHRQSAGHENQNETRKGVFAI